MTAAIIGGGAAGLLAACALVRSGVDAVLFEKQDRVGRKLLSTGNGRCNLTNLNASEKDYHGSPRHIRAALEAFPPDKAVRFFESLGLSCYADEAGRVYPSGNMAAGVLDALRLYASENGCRIETGFEVTRVAKRKGGFLIEAADGRREAADKVLICCGGLAAPKLGGCGDGCALLKSFGHAISPRFPAIAPLKTPPEDVRSLKGQRVRGSIALVVDGREVRRETGEILFNDGVISGIAAMQLARDVNLAIARGKKCRAEIRLTEDKDAARRRAASLPERPAEDLLSGLVPKRVGQLVMKRAGVQPLTLPAKALTEAQIRAIEAELRALTFDITGTQGYDAAQVTCGGAELRDFDPDTLGSKLCPGLYAAGETLDIDGDCGGFNLQWAWAGAWMAAKAIAGE